MFKNIVVGLLMLSLATACSAQETTSKDASNSTDKVTFTVANGKFKFNAPSSWEKKTPKSNMLEAEFSVPKTNEQDPANGRITFMAAGGSIKANLDRWMGQFKNADGSAIADVEPSVFEVDGKKVHLLDLRGTFADSMRGPMGPKTNRENYRMLGTIVENEGGLYFIKFYGPKPIVDANADEFQSMLKGLNGADASNSKVASEPIVFQVADDGLEFTAPGTWNKVTPRSNMLDAEFEIPKTKDGENNGRLTIMGAGGSVEANMNRWIGQFMTPDGDPISGIEPTKFNVAGQQVHLLDVSGVFMDSMGGPQGPKTERDDYRMLASIIETEEFGKYFVKFYGPKSVVDVNEEAYKKMINSLKLIE